ncbi:MAG: Type I-F CRISPR-associated endoribonuclease Cas6/Csy4 [uncultured Sulfurovum sp.]|uniref:Type I-F CRISPR-associated endoribonuclease Cas6/Csy4 n=1 Tax=uncultured Sulfurovum sp. TaxID=269237 RepID=A0A6S6TAD0_9BACT|nr:MAG: Type I-F CRISPR-associated endoribonuclease Cas6/Csy4 [uncultured Sulfurovum sp.]
MNYYVDIKLFTDTEITLGFVWKKLYAQVHLALVEVRDEKNLVSMGLSFPKYKESAFPLGNELRIFAKTKDELERLDLNRWLERLLDYVSVSPIKEVPSSVNEFVSFGRKQFKVNAERLARRQAKRKGISFEEALKNYEDFDEEKQKTKLPFVNIKSLSSDREMKIFIQKSDNKEQKEGLFSTYGLSNEATVPWF